MFETNIKHVLYFAGAPPAADTHPAAGVLAGALPVAGAPPVAGVGPAAGALAGAIPADVGQLPPIQGKEIIESLKSHLHMNNEGTYLYSIQSRTVRLTQMRRSERISLLPLSQPK